MISFWPVSVLFDGDGWRRRSVVPTGTALLYLISSPGMPKAFHSDRQ
jgi:hypothetical protein